MPNSVTVAIDPNTLAERLDGVTLTNALKPFLKAAARVTADAVRQDAKDRLRRQLSGTSTGETVAGIVVKSDRTGWGWIVDAGNLTTPMLDRWLENGTRFMKPRAFFYSSAQLEESAHRDRIRAAVAAGLSEYGLGDGH